MVVTQCDCLRTASCPSPCNSDGFLILIFISIHGLVVDSSHEERITLPADPGRSRGNTQTSEYNPFGSEDEGNPFAVESHNPFELNSSADGKLFIVATLTSVLLSFFTIYGLAWSTTDESVPTLHLIVRGQYQCCTS